MLYFMTDRGQMKLEYFAISGTSLVPSLIRFWLLLTRVAWEEVMNQDSYRLTWRRLMVFVTSACAISVLIIWNHIGFVLDDILFPAWRKTAVHQPLCLVGNARSGTTWLHRLITKDSKHFTTMQTWEIVFSASVTWRVLFCALYHVDAWCARGWGLWALRFVEDLLLGDRHVRASYVHPLGLFEAEEDEWLMVHVAYAQLILFIYPLGMKTLNPIIQFDHAEKDGLPPALKAAIFGHYKQCVQRHLYFHNHLTPGSRQRIFVCKNPTFTLRIPTIYETFPDARVVCLLRDPVQAIPSMISYVAKVNQIFAEPVQRYPNARTLLGFCLVHYMFPLQHLRTNGEGHRRDLVVSSVTPSLTTISSASPSSTGLERTDSCQGDADRAGDAQDNNAQGDVASAIAATFSDPLLDGVAVPDSDRAAAAGEDVGGHAEDQWAFVSYHHLRRDLKHTVLALLQRLYGPRWYCRCGAAEAQHTEMNNSGGECVCSVSLDEFCASLHAAQLNADGYVTKHQHSVEQCCGGMTVVELKEALKEVYEAHAGAF